MPLAFLGMIISHSLSLYRTAVYVSLFLSQCLGRAQIDVDAGNYLDAASQISNNRVSLAISSLYCG